MIKGVDMQGRRRWVSRGAGGGRLESKGKEGGKVMLKKGSFCVVTNAVPP